MPKQKLSKPHLKAGASLVFISILIFAYTKFINSTEASTTAEIISIENCIAKNNPFISEKRICTNYKFNFTYKEKKYFGWTKFVRSKTETHIYNKVYFSTMRPQATASLRSVADRSQNLIALALSALALSLYFFYKQLVGKSHVDAS